MYEPSIGESFFLFNGLFNFSLQTLHVDKAIMYHFPVSQSVSI